VKEFNCVPLEGVEVGRILAVQEMGYRFTEVGQALNIHPVNIARSLEKGEKLFDQYAVFLF
jgi:hypothetical protein